MQPTAEKIILSVLILPLTTLYHRPKQIETEVQGNLYLDELARSVAAETTDAALLRAAWERLKQTWQFGWWPTVHAVLDAIREERKLRPTPALPRVSPAAVRAREIEGRCRVVFESIVGQELLAADLGPVLEESFIAKDLVKLPGDVTDRVILECERIRRRYLAAVVDAQQLAAEGNAYAHRLVSWARAIDERNERLKERYLPGYTPKLFPPLPVMAPPPRRLGVGDDWDSRANWVHRPPAREEGEEVQHA